MRISDWMSDVFSSDLEATRPERLLSPSARPPRPACPSPLRLGQAIDPIEQEPGMPTSKIDRMPLLLVALVLAAAAVPGRALDLDPRHDGIDTADLSVTVTNKSRRRVEQTALREPDGIERDSDAFGYYVLAPGRQRTFTVAGGAGVCTYEISVLFEGKDEDCCSDQIGSAHV